MLCEHEEEKKKVMDWRVEELKGLKSKGADDLDCLCKTKDYDSLSKVKE